MLQPVEPAEYSNIWDEASGVMCIPADQCSSCEHSCVFQELQEVCVQAGALPDGGQSGWSGGADAGGHPTESQQCSYSKTRLASSLLSLWVLGPDSHLDEQLLHHLDSGVFMLADGAATTQNQHVHI